MVRLAADENLDNDILRALKRRLPEIDVVRVQDEGLSGASDPDVLEWASRGGRILVTHDAATMIHFALERVDAGLAMPGLIIVRQTVPVSAAVSDLLLVNESSLEDELEGRMVFLPL